MSGLLSRYGYHLVVATFASLVYLNSLPNEFAFDDLFAITRNKDVTDPSVPLKDLLHHDFWGQEVSKRDSHKSYRPVTVLSFRLNDRLASRQAAKDGQGVHPHPWGFHVVNILLHALASALFYQLARKILVPSHAATRQGGPHGAAWSRWSRHVALAAGLLFAVHPVHTEAVTGIVGRAEMLSSCFFISSLLMYIKSVDQDDGRMEWVFLLASVVSAFLGSLAKETAITVLGALIVYDIVQPRPHRDAVDAGAAADDDVSSDGDEDGGARLLSSDRRSGGDKDKLSDDEDKGEQEGKGGMQADAATPGKIARSKGVASGATSVGRELTLSTVRQRKGGAVAAGAVTPQGLQGRQAAQGSDDEDDERIAEVMSRAQKRTIRLGAVLATVMLLMVIRRMVTGNDFVVTIFRKVENPLAYQPSWFRTALGVVQLHALYFGLLLFPHPLSADWSFECIPLIESVSDVRILGPILLYAAAIMVAVKAQLHRWDTAGGPWWCARMAAPDINRAIFFQVVALLGGPFLPSSNILFFVGTYIGERLLYLPSTGFCMLLATLLFHLLAPATPPDGDATVRIKGAKGSSGASKKAAIDGGKDKGASVAGQVSTAWAWRVVAVIVFAFSWRTWTRNVDWLNEATLFESAMNVCPRSAKVLLNSGILARTRGDWESCLEHMRKAKEVEPGYCDPDYWIGLTHINQAQAGVGKEDETAVFAAGIGNLTLGIRCLHTVAESMRVLHQLFKFLHDKDPTNGEHMDRFGSLFEDLGLVDEACHHWNMAAETYNRAGNRYAAQELVHRCKKLRLHPPPKRFKELDGAFKDKASPSHSPGRGPPRGAHPSLLSRSLNDLIPGDNRGGQGDADPLGAGTRSGPSGGVDDEKGCSEEFDKIAGEIAAAERHGMVPGVSPIPPSLRARLYFFLANWNETCSRITPYFYTLTVNAMQKLDSEDPWLHRAWAEAIVAALNVDGLGTTVKQAVTHMKVAGMILTSLGKRMLEQTLVHRIPWVSADLPFRHDEKHYAVDIVTGQKLSAESVFLAAESTLARAEEFNMLIPDDSSLSESCQLRLFRGHAMLVVAHHLSALSPQGLGGRNKGGSLMARAQLAGQQAVRLFESILPGGGGVAGDDLLAQLGPCPMEVQMVASKLAQSLGGSNRMQS
eukprot:jgi/Mesvir1/27823/Mv07501-RA.1